MNDSWRSNQGGRVGGGGGGWGIGRTRSPFFHSPSRPSHIFLAEAGVLPIMAYTWRLRPKGVPFSGFRYMKG